MNLSQDTKYKEILWITKRTLRKSTGGDDVKKKKQKQRQWGIVLIIGLFILIGTVGHLETGGDILPNVFKGITGMLIAIWGIIKSYQWGFFREEGKVER